MIAESCKPIVDEALKNATDATKVDMHVTWTANELHQTYGEVRIYLSRKQMLVHLWEHLGDENVVVNVDGYANIIGFKKLVAKYLKLENQASSTEDDEVGKLVRRITAAMRNI